VKRFLDRMKFVLPLTIALLIPLGSGATAAPFEPNDSYIAATGPIFAGTNYSGALETSNDNDYFFFYLPQQTQLQFRLTNTSSKESTICSQIAQQRPDEVDYVSNSSLAVHNGESSSGAVTLEPGKYYFIVNCPSVIGESYTFSLSPPGVTSTYEPFAIACAAAHPPVATAAAEVELANRKLRRVKQALAAGSHWKAKRKRRARAKIVHLKKMIAQKQAAFDAAAANEQAACSVPQ
jgi:hypothetical protein